MTKSLKIVYILSDGRSGSTLLESILNNADDVVSVGECFRFWERYYKNDTLCGCGDRIGVCALWHEVHANLIRKFPDYDIQVIKTEINKLLLFRNFNHQEKASSKFKFILTLVREFYLSISQITGKHIIIDSSKSPSFARLLTFIEDFDLYIIHLERSLPEVASSWKKTMILPEYFNQKVHMPVKSDVSIIRTWLRVKVLAHRLKKYPYYFVRYEELCEAPTKILQGIFIWCGFNFNSAPSFSFKSNHAIAGNPVRMSGENRIIIRPLDKRIPENLSFLKYYFFKFIDNLSNSIF